MNKQGKLIDGKVAGGIEWTKTVLPDGTERQGYTWNPVGGCLHECQWKMPDGSIATCYAKEVALGVAGRMYPDGFEAHYWNPDRLFEPQRVQQPARIFIDSMADLMGHWVPKEQIEQVLDVCRKCSWHTFQLLTKNPKRLLEFDPFPPNVWPGFSTPPDFMWGRRLSGIQQVAKLQTDLQAMRMVKAAVKWCSVEPLSWDVSEYFEGCGLDWVVIGAASNGPKKYQPKPDHIENLLDCLDEQNIPVFFKGNLIWDPWREEFPAVETVSI